MVSPAVTASVMAADVIVSDWVVTFVDDANKSVLIVPTQLNPVIQNMGPA